MKRAPINARCPDSGNNRYCASEAHFPGFSQMILWVSVLVACTMRSIREEILVIGMITRISAQPLAKRSDTQRRDFPTSPGTCTCVMPLAWSCLAMLIAVRASSLRSTSFCV